jgi:hypothetical protein
MESIRASKSRYLAPLYSRACAGGALDDDDLTRSAQDYGKQEQDLLLLFSAEEDEEGEEGEGGQGEAQDDASPSAEPRGRRAGGMGRGRGSRKRRGEGLLGRVRHINMANELRSFVEQTLGKEDVAETLGALADHKLRSVSALNELDVKDWAELGFALGVQKGLQNALQMLSGEAAVFNISPTRSARECDVLLQWPEDVLLLLGEACSDPLAPEVLARLAATCCQNLMALRPKLIELREFHIEVHTLCIKCHTELSSLVGPHMFWNFCPLTPADLELLARLLKSGSLRHVCKLFLTHSQVDDQGIASLSHGLSKVWLPRLQHLSLVRNRIGDDGMQTLASVIHQHGALSTLQTLYLSGNQIGDAGMAAFAGTIANGLLPKLCQLHLSKNRIGDEGIDSFCSAVARSGSLSSPQDLPLSNLRELLISDNEIEQEGMTTLSLAIEGGALPSLRLLRIQRNPADATSLQDSCESRGVLCEL